MGPTALTFTDNGKHLLVGYEDGKVSMLLTDNAQEIFQVKIVDFGAPITALEWQEAHQERKQGKQHSEFCRHLKDMHSLDPKAANEVMEKFAILNNQGETTSLLYCADAALNISLLY